MKVLVTSSNKDKVGAVELAFKRVFADEEIFVSGVSTPSGVNEQPEGSIETLKGAVNRLAYARKHSQLFDFVVSIENGITLVYIDEEERWFDIAWVVIEDKKGKKYASQSAGLEFPYASAMAAMREGFKTTTVGSVIAKTHPESSSSDPHSFLTNGFTNRSELLEQAIRIALSLAIKG